MRRVALPLVAALVLPLCAARSSADVMDTVNENASTAAGLYWAGTEVGWFYTPSASYHLSGIETRFASTDGRTVTLEFFQNGPRAVPGWLLLGTAGVVTHGTPAWSVGTFSSPISLTAGSTYFLGFRGTQMTSTLLGCNVTGACSAQSLPYRFGWTGTGQYENGFGGTPFIQPILRLNGEPAGWSPRLER